MQLTRAGTWALSTPHLSFFSLGDLKHPTALHVPETLKDASLAKASLLSFRQDHPLPTRYPLSTALSPEHLKRITSKAEVLILPALSLQSVPPPAFSISVNGPFIQALAPARNVGVILALFFPSVFKSSDSVLRPLLPG